MPKKQYHSDGGSMSGALVQDATQDDLVDKGQQFYDRQLKAVLEPDHAGRFVAIEPDSGRYFLADTGRAALRAARAEVPGKLFYLVRIGHRAAYRIGGYGSRTR
ncbi:MAG: hypothetical protein AABO57_21670 [Acidobacteriota bacterium]